MARRKWRIEDDNRIPEILRQLDYLDQQEIHVGVLGDAESHMIMIATVNEFGIDIDVTDKMRNYLRATGLPLKATTTQIKIPERSYIRSTMDENKDKINEFTKLLLALVIKGHLSGHVAFDRLGNYLKSLIQKQIRDIKTPPNHPYTVDRKGSNNPLIDSGRLRQSIMFEVVKK